MEYTIEIDAPRAKVSELFAASLRERIGHRLDSLANTEAEVARLLESPAAQSVPTRAP